MKTTHRDHAGHLASDRFVVFRKIAYGPFDSPKAAIDWADERWPGEEHEVYGLHNPDRK